eukprot:2598398-Pyramimonas_sp.AAC.1
MPRTVRSLEKRRGTKKGGEEKEDEWMHRKKPIADGLAAPVAAETIVWSGMRRESVKGRAA